MFIDWLSKVFLTSLCEVPEFFARHPAAVTLPPSSSLMLLLLLILVHPSTVISITFSVSTPLVCLARGAFRVAGAALGDDSFTKPGRLAKVCRIKSGNRQLRDRWLGQCWPTPPLAEWLRQLYKAGESAAQQYRNPSRPLRDVTWARTYFALGWVTSRRLYMLGRLDWENARRGCTPAVIRGVSSCGQGSAEIYR